MKRKILIFYSILILIGLFSAGCKKSEKLLAGGFTEGNEKGLMLYELNTQNGNLSLISETDAGANPSFFCYSKNRDFIYAINEVPDFSGLAAGGLTTLKYDPASGKIGKQS